MTAKERVIRALNHSVTDRVPVDFLATPEIWEKLIDHFDIREKEPDDSRFFDPVWEKILTLLKVDCRVLSYDQFFAPPEHSIFEGARIEWWKVFGRSSPNRMWRQITPDGTRYDIFGRRYVLSNTQTGTYENNMPVLKDAESVDDLKKHPWPEPDWWDFSTINHVIDEINQEDEYHIRFRIGSVFEIAWQMRGMEQFFMDMALEPDIPVYIMTRLCEIYIANLTRILDLAGEQIDMVFFYDDVASTENMMMSKKMWEILIKPHHQKIIDVARKFDKPVMYHACGAMYPLIPDLIEMGVDVLNPIQVNAAGMDPRVLKREFGEKICFHGGINIVETLPKGTTEEVQAEVLDRIKVLGENGGYIMSSSHHIQSDTPLENVLAMYDMELRS
ncbi:MAG: hypothetical protein HQM13_08040 [SAR324 cluster bacterium]|nr:hypothetical protein [SAR324 cluster bacterium]